MSANGSITLFAPNNQAFSRVPQTHKAGGCLKLLMRNHLIHHVMCSPIAAGELYFVSYILCVLK